MQSWRLSWGLPSMCSILQANFLIPTVSSLEKSIYLIEINKFKCRIKGLPKESHRKCHCLKSLHLNAEFMFLEYKLVSYSCSDAWNLCIKWDGRVYTYIFINVWYKSKMTDLMMLCTSNFQIIIQKPYCWNFQKRK